MIPGILNGKIIFYWQTEKNVPQSGDRINYDGIVYSVKYRHYDGKDLQLILSDTTLWPE